MLGHILVKLAQLVLELGLLRVMNETLCHQEKQMLQ